MEDNHHGNSKKSKKKQHVYEILDSEKNDETAKFGISGQKLNKNGTSPRANSQVNKWNLINGFIRFFARILKKDIEGRKKALEIEEEYVREFKKEKGRLPLRQKKPNPEIEDNN